MALGIQASDHRHAAGEGPDARDRGAAYPPQRVLMAPGPSNIHPRVMQAMSAPLLGHKDPVFLEIMDEVVVLLREVFGTSNAATFALPATGGSGMEAGLVNLLEPGDTVVIGRAGFFADRMVQIAERLDARAVVVDAPWGQAVDVDEVVRAVRDNGARVAALVHGETSSGVLQPLDGLGDVCREVGAFLVVDTVASLGGVPFSADASGVDICYSGSQKCLSAPPGLCPITLSDRAVAHIQGRSRAVQTWYLDLILHSRYWGDEHIYHHTGPVLNVYALREALRIVLEEGLEAGWARHTLHARALQAGLETLGLRMFADPRSQLDTVVAVLLPEGVSGSHLRTVLLDKYDIEVAGGLGQYADNMLRIGVMGQSAKRQNILLLLAALQEGLRAAGRETASGLDAAVAVYGDL